LISKALRSELIRPIAYYSVFTDITGSVIAGVMLSQIYYWQDRCPADRDGWWWKTAKEWTEETGLTRREQQRARKILVKLGIIEEVSKGAPCRLWFRLNLERLLLEVQSAVTRQTVKVGKPVCRDAAGKFAKLPQTSNPRNRQTITKTTTKTTEDESKDYPAEGGQVVSQSDEKQYMLELEQEYGVCVPQSIVMLNNLNRVSNILQKRGLDSEAVRLLFAEFEACCCRKEVQSPWALLATLTRKASEGRLRLSLEGEKSIPAWID